MNICYVIGAGEVSSLKFIPCPNDMIICADGGYRYAISVGLTPDLVVGDFDSLEYIPNGVNTDVYPAEKNFTDSFIAVERGIKAGFTHFELFGLLGGRADHTFSNYELLSYIADAGCSAVAYGEKCKVYMVKNGSKTLDKRSNGIISVFSFADKSEGITIKGLKYEVENFTMTNSLTRGISNEFCGKEAEISVENGKLIVFESLDG